jgi:hypothetical protein
MKVAYLFIIVLLLHSCSNDKGSFVLSASDSALCDTLGLNKTVVMKVRKYTDAPFLKGTYSSTSYYVQSHTESEIRTELPGISFKINQKRAEEIVFSLRDQFEREGYFIIVGDKNYGLKGKPDEVSIIKAKDQYEVLQLIQTNGINYEIDNDSVIAIIREFDKKYSLRLIGAGTDWCEFSIERAPDSWLNLANEVYNVCPDVVDQGIGTIEDFAVEMERTKQLHFWWD